jgi:hypothetical protein
MRAHSDQLAEVLQGSFSSRLIADVFHGTERVKENLDLTGWSQGGDLTAEVKESGRATVVYQSIAGESLKPLGTEGILSPFRARLFLLMEISEGAFSETIKIGWATVTDVPYARDHYSDIAGKRIVVASVVDLVFQSLDEDVKAWGFRSEEQPPSLTSAYAELRRITNMPVIETLPDRAIPQSITYEASKGGRLKGVQTLAGLFDGRAVVNPAGAWTIVPHNPGPVVGTLSIGPDGTVTDVPYSVTTEGVFNCVIGNFETADRTPIFSIAELTIGPLATSNGERTEWVGPNDLVRTQAAGDSWVKAVLDRSTRTQQYDVAIQCVVNPLIELGDMLEVVGNDAPLKGQVVKIDRSNAALMNVTLRAERSL